MERYDLPDGWEWKTVGDLVKVNYGDSLQKQKRRGGDIVVYGSNGEIGRHDEAITRGATIVIGRKGSAGEVHFSEKPCWAIDTTYFIDEFPSELDIKFLYHFLKSQNLGDLDRSTAIPGLNRNDLYAVDLPLPPFPDQQRIVNRIESLFEQSRTARTALTRVPALMSRFRRAVLASAFRGELVESDPNDGPASLLLERIREAREQSGHKQSLEPVDTSELLELPRGWEWAKVEQIAEVRLGRQRSPSRATGPNMRPYLRAANVTWSGLDLSDVKEMDFTPAEQETYKLRTGDIVLSEASGSISEVGKPAIWNDEIENCCIQNTLIRVRSNGPLPEYLYYHFLFDALTARFSEVAQGIGINHLGAKGLSNWVISIPPLQTQQRIVDKIKSLFAQADIIEQAASVSLRRAEQVDQSILARAFRGELG